MVTKPMIRTGARAPSPKPAVPAKTTVTTGTALAKPTTSKAPAKGLTFTHNGHRYRLDGMPVTGVTTILGGGIPKPALVRWAPRVVAEWVTDPANRERLETVLATAVRGLGTLAVLLSPVLPEATATLWAALGGNGPVSGTRIDRAWEWTGGTHVSPLEALFPRIEVPVA